MNILELQLQQHCYEQLCEILEDRSDDALTISDWIYERTHIYS